MVDENFSCKNGDMLENRTQRKLLLCNESFLFCLHMICSRTTDKNKMCKNMNQTTVHEYLKNSAIYLAKKKKLMLIID